MDQKPLVYIIILNWNGKHLLDRCLKSLKTLTYSNYKIVVVDNGSTDGSQEFIFKNYPEVHLIKNKKNLGFAEGNNRGIRYAILNNAEYIVLLNNDTEVTAEWLNKLVEKAEKNSSIGILGSKMLLYADPKKINSTGLNLNWLGYCWDRGLYEENTEKWNKEDVVLGVSGSALFVKRQVIEKIGLLDPNYFIYFEDIDFCMRAWNAGYECLYVPDAIIYHRFSATVGRKSPRQIYLLERNRFYFLFKHFPIKILLKVFPKITKDLLTLFIRWIKYPFIKSERQKSTPNGLSIHFKALLRIAGLLSAVFLLPPVIVYRLKRKYKVNPKIWSLIHNSWEAPQIFS